MSAQASVSNGHQGSRVVETVQALVESFLQSSIRVLAT
jgi:hypothetical protein